MHSRNHNHSFEIKKRAARSAYYEASSASIMVHDNHFLLVTFPAQGHINPALQFAKNLIRTGAQVTFVTTVSAERSMSKASTPSSTPDGLTFALFSDGYDDGFNSASDSVHFMSEIKRCGSQKLTQLILSFADQSRPITCVIYTLLLPWAVEVARDLNIQAALLWIQPATVFDVYYYYFSGHGYRDAIANDSNHDLSYSVKFPGLPLLACRELPSFMIPSNPYSFVLQSFEEQFQVLERETKPRVLVNTFDALEPEALRAVDKINLMGIGPLIPSVFLDCKDTTDTSIGGDLLHSSNKSNYVEWLNSHEKSSVVYVSFGTIVVLGKKQMEEIERGLIESGRPFLWVIREQDKASKEEEAEEDCRSMLCRINEGSEQGMIVGWCSQVQVLTHPSVGCFVTHCGWNSSLESLAGGVPMVAFPQWSDQGTNAKLIEDVWKMGVRVRVKEEEKIVESDEIKRCLEIVMGERGEDMRKNAKKWKDLAREAVGEGGSSDRNLRGFVEDVGH